MYQRHVPEMRRKRRSPVARDYHDLGCPGGAQIGDAALDHRDPVEGQQRLERPHAGGKPRGGDHSPDFSVHFVPPLSSTHIP